MSMDKLRSVLDVGSVGLHMNIGGMSQTTRSLPATAVDEVAAVPGPPMILIRILVIVLAPM